MSRGETPFWVIFDIAPKREYYSDVHKLLALPDGALLTYDYRDVHLDAGALAAVGSRTPPTQVLLAYAQWESYARGTEAPREQLPFDQMRWQAMRLAEMTGVWKTGENNYFQFRVGAYPRADPRALLPIIEELYARESAPYAKLVATSTEADALRALRSADPGSEWEDIVRHLGTPPMQFQGDTFWRVARPARSKWRRGTPLKDEYRPGPTGTPEQTHRWIVPEQSEFAIAVTMREPVVRVEETGVPRIKVNTPDKGPLHAPHPDVIDLRRNATVNLALEAQHSSNSDRRVGSLTLESEHALPHLSPDDLTLTFALRLARWKRLVGALLILAALAGTAVAAIATRITTSEANVPVMAAASVACVLIGAAGTFLYTGRLPVKT